MQLTHDNFGGLRGLTEAEAAARLKAEGFNELPAAKPRNFLATLWEILCEPSPLSFARTSLLPIRPPSSVMAVTAPQYIAVREMFNTAGLQKLSVRGADVPDA